MPRHSTSVTLLQLDAEDTDARHCLAVQDILTYFVAKVNTVERYICIMAQLFMAHVMLQHTSGIPQFPLRQIMGSHFTCLIDIHKFAEETD